jgi:hypothetical protein
VKFYCKAVAACTIFMLLTCVPLLAATWYVRPDGGTRYSANVRKGQCNGLYDASYASTGGTGVNQNCAFNDVRYLWQDGSYTTGSDNGPAVFPGWGWVIAGGDTVIIRGSIGTGVSYRVGWNNKSNAYDAKTKQFWGVAGDPFGSGAPPPPSGSSTQHTRILGENYLSCHNSTAKTQLHGGFAVGSVLAMNGTSYVDLACLDITDFANCGRQGQRIGCNTSIGSLDDDASNGISWNNRSTNDTLTDIHIHGMAMNGMLGPTGTGMAFSYLDLMGNASSGWNADAGDGTTGTGTLLVQHFNVGWNGCTEEFPIVDPTPYFDCTDDNDAGYGDGFGTATVLTRGWKIHWDQGNVFYNTQDGLDQLHVVGPGSSTTVTRVLAYGNMGQQLKIGGQVGIIQNSLIVGNCNALRQAIPGTPAGYNSGLTDFCRAADTAIVLSVNDASTSKFENNTLFSANATGLDIQTALTCTTTTCLIDFDNNIFVGFLNNTADGYPSGGTGNYANPIYLNDTGGALAFGNAGSSFSNNITHHAKSNWICPATWLNEKNALCRDPHLVDETWHVYGYGNMARTSDAKGYHGKIITAADAP